MIIRTTLSSILLIGAWSFSAASAEPAQQCSRNADDIKAAVVIQKENGEFCAQDEAGQRASQEELAAYYAKFNAPPVKEFDPRRGGNPSARAGDPRAYMMSLVAQKCAEAGSGAAMCEQMASGMIDAALAEYRAKCAAQGVDAGQCNAMIAQEVASRQM